MQESTYVARGAGVASVHRVPLRERKQLSQSAAIVPEAPGNALRFQAERVGELFWIARSAYIVSLVNGAILVLILWGPIAVEVLVSSTWGSTT